MESFLTLAANATATIWSWLSSAFYDVRAMGEAAKQHTTTNGLLLIAFAICLLSALVALSLRIRRVSILKARARRHRDRLTFAIAGSTKFLGTAAIGEPSTSFEASEVRPSVKRASLAKRTETKVMDVPPYREQQVIDLMAHFGWELQSSTPVHTKDSHLERRGDTIYSVTETEDYIHLVFVRDLNLPHIDRLRRLEAEYFSITLPGMPGYLGPILLALPAAGAALGGPATRSNPVAAIVIAILVIIWAINISGRRKKAEEEKERLLTRQAEILLECETLLENAATEMAA